MPTTVVHESEHGHARGALPVKLGVGAIAAGVKSSAGERDKCRCCA